MADVLGVIAALAALYFAYKFVAGRIKAAKDRKSGGTGGNVDKGGKNYPK